MSGRIWGRDEEVSRAVGLLAGKGGGHVAVVGAPGIGKSALLAEVQDQVSAAGVNVRVTAGAVSEMSLPFVGLHDLLVEDLTAGSVQLAGPLRHALDVAVLRTAAAVAAVDPVTLNLAVLRTVEDLTARTRLLLVLDDLPWVDAASRSALAFVLRRLPPSRVSTLVAMRPDAPQVELASTASIETIRVGPLDPVTLRNVVEDRTGRRIPTRVADRLHHASGGNPLLAVEILRAALMGRQGGQEHVMPELPVPERYKAVLSPRLSELSADARRALLAAALMSRPALEELARVVSLPGLLEAEAVGVVEVRSGLVRFEHPLLAALCRETASSAERQAMHLALADACHDEVERARHLGTGTLVPDAAVAQRLAESAERARSRAAVWAAADLMAAAERLTPAACTEERVARACAAAELHAATGDADTAAGLLREALTDVPRGPLRSRVLATLADVVGEDPAGSARLLEEALSQPGLAPHETGELRLRRSYRLTNFGQLAAAGSEAAEVAEAAEAAGHEDLARRCRCLAAFTDVAQGMPPGDSGAWRRMVAEAGQHRRLEYDHPRLYQAWDAMSREDHAVR